MLSAINACGTKAANIAESLIQSNGFYKREVVSRFATTFTAVPLLLLDAAANLATGVAKTAWSPIAKLYELAAAFFGADRLTGNYLCEAFNHFGKSLAGVLAAVLTIPVGILYPMAAIAMYRGFGLATSTPKSTESLQFEIQANEPIHQELVSNRSIVSSISEEVEEQNSLSAPNLEPSFATAQKEQPSIALEIVKKPVILAARATASAVMLFNQIKGLWAVYSPKAATTAINVLQNSHFQVGAVTYFATLAFTGQIGAYNTILGTFLAGACYVTKPAPAPQPYVA